MEEEAVSDSCMPVILWRFVELAKKLGESFNS
jgi:hypothetical protein